MRAASPPDEPPGTRDAEYGLDVAPKMGLRHSKASSVCLDEPSRSHSILEINSYLRNIGLAERYPTSLAIQLHKLRI
jgi:hypothetical protein